MPRDYIELDLISDPDEFTRLGREWLEMAIPGYQWEEAQIETLLAQAWAFMAGEFVDQVASVPPVIFGYLGRWLLGVEPYAPLPATGFATLTFNASGLTSGVPSGWQLLISRPDGTTTLVATETDVVAPVGGGVVSVEVSSLTEGVEDNGAGGAAQPIEPLDGITSVTVTPLAGGADAEDGDAYLDRLAARMTLLSPRPILPEDYALVASQVPGVGRAVAIDLYQPASTESPIGTPVTGASASPVAGAITVSVTNDAGGVPTTGLKTDVFNAINDDRVLNVVPYVIGPTISTVGVQLTAVAYPGQTRQTVLDAVRASLTEWLDGLNWGAQSTGSGADWTNVKTVRISEAVDWANRPVGVNYIDLSTVKLKLNAGSWVSTDLALPGTAPLPAIGDLTGVAVLLSTEATP